MLHEAPAGGPPQPPDAERCPNCDGLGGFHTRRDCFDGEPPDAEATAGPDDLTHYMEATSRLSIENADLRASLAAAEGREQALRLRELALLECLTSIQEYCGYHYRDKQTGFEPVNIARRAIVANEESRAALAKTGEPQ